MKLDKKMTKAEEQNVTVVLVCPHCGGNDLHYEGGFITGTKYHCKDCHYVGTFVLERRVVVGEDEDVREL